MSRHPLFFPHIALKVGGGGCRGGLCNLCGQGYLGSVNQKYLSAILEAKEEGKCEHIVGG